LSRTLPAGIKRDRGEEMKNILFVIGMPRCATTSLCNVLGQHPDIRQGVLKEPGFFVSSLRLSLHAFNSDGSKVRFSSLGYLETQEDYCKNFGGIEKEGVYLDGSTIYSLHISTFIENIKSTQLLDGLDKKFIILHRNQKERAISHYKFSLARGEEFRTFEKALIDECEKIYPNWILGGYLKGGRYDVVADAITNNFGEESLLVIDIETDSLFSSECFNKITSFLGINRYCFDFNVYRNTNIDSNNKLILLFRVMLKRLRQLNPTFFEKKFFRYLHGAVMKCFIQKSNLKDSVRDEELRHIYSKYIDERQ